MLPTKGYFQDIECPYLDNSCNRPYCHFRHKKKMPENTDEKPIEENHDAPTYKPTPKRELSSFKSHIPICYVPDVASPKSRIIKPLPIIKRPIYNPTPLSVLSSTNSTDNDTNEETNIKKSNNEVNTSSSSLPVNISPTLDIDFEKLTSEINLIDTLLDDDNYKSPYENLVEEKSNENKLVKKEDEKQSKDIDNRKTSNGNSDHHRSYKRKSEYSRSRNKSDNYESKHYHRSSSSKRKHRSDERDKNYEKDKHESGHSSKKHRYKSSRKYDRSYKNKNDDKEENKIKSNDRKVESCNLKFNNNNSNEAAASIIFNDDDDDDDDGNETDTFMECYKIFNEYKPPENDKKKSTIDEKQKNDNDTFTSGKKRIAHCSNDLVIPTMNFFNKRKIISSPDRIMTNRYKIAKLTHENNEQSNEIKQYPIPSTKTTTPDFIPILKKHNLLRTPKITPTTSYNVVDNILNESKGKIKKIAPVQNVKSFQLAKAKINELPKPESSIPINVTKTVAQTTKGNKRVAHIPDMSLANIPDVLHSHKSKLPINVRTRFLTMIAEECVKLYEIKNDAYTRALNEEFTCYEKCKVLATYKNSAMLAVNRLRKELQERIKSGLGVYGPNETLIKNTSSQFSGKQFYNNIKHYLLKDEEFDIHGYPRESMVTGVAVIKNFLFKKRIKLNPNERQCSRCAKIYVVDVDGLPIIQEHCVFHPMKKRTFRGKSSYLCCKVSDNGGCVTSNTHVCDFVDDSAFEGFQMTLNPETDNDPRSYAVYALDCEMCYTTKGLELTHITIVDVDCKVIYESLVKPLNPIIDYNTHFSGITKEQMDKTSTSILQVQANILHLCNSKTILIGHSLESDLKALKIIHYSVIDTAVLFPHKMDLPHKKALKMLASEFLQKIIQNSVNGHDSAEDAITCMELVKWKLTEELKVRGIK